jgi:hypothetical protein
MNKKRVSIHSVLFVLFLFLLSSITIAAIDVPDPIVTIQDTAKLGCVYYFYGDECPGCEETNLFIQSIEQRYPSIEVQKFEVYYDHDNLALLNALFKSYQVPSSDQGVPAVFMARTYFVGERSIFAFLDEQLKNSPKLDCPTPDLEEVFGIVGASDPTDVIKSVGVIGLTGTALKNSFSACGIALLLVFLLLLMLFLEEDKETKFSLEKRREELIRKTIIFLAGIFIVVLMLGFNIIPFALFESTGGVITVLVALLSIIVGITFIKHFLISGQIIPRNYLKKIIPPYHKFMGYCKHSAGFFIMGLLSALLLTVCWGWKYRVILILLSDPIIRWRAFPLFLWHTIVVLLPLAIIATILYMRLEKLERVHEHENIQLHQLKILRFIIACVLFVLGILVLFLV